MISQKAFFKERRDLGIYKAIGFKLSQLRLQFAFRYLLTALTGSVIGMLLNLLFASKVLNSLMSMLGFCSYPMQYDVIIFVLPALLLSLSFFVFAYIASSEIKKVEVRELVSE